MQQEFMEQADEIVREFLQYLDTGENQAIRARVTPPFLSIMRDVPDINRESPLFDFEELAKYHRKIWLQWARALKSEGEDVPDGWLTDYHRQTEPHQQVQRRQAAGLFALGYQAALHAMHEQTPESEAKMASIGTTKRSVIQAFNVIESRILIAAVMSFAAETLQGKVNLSKPTVDGLLAKLEMLADVNLDHVEYFEMEGAKKATKVKPKWKKQKKEVKGRVGLGHLLKGNR